MKAFQLLVACFTAASGHLLYGRLGRFHGVGKVGGMGLLQRGLGKGYGTYGTQLPLSSLGYRKRYGRLFSGYGNGFAGYGIGLNSGSMGNVRSLDVYGNRYGNGGYGPLKNGYGKGLLISGHGIGFNGLDRFSNGFQGQNVLFRTQHNSEMNRILPNSMLYGGLVRSYSNMHNDGQIDYHGMTPVIHWLNLQTDSVSCQEHPRLPSRQNKNFNQLPTGRILISAFRVSTYWKYAPLSIGVYSKKGRICSMRSKNRLQEPSQHRMSTQRPANTDTTFTCCISMLVRRSVLVRNAIRIRRWGDRPETPTLSPMSNTVIIV